MVGSEAIRRGVKQGVDEALMTAMIRKLVEKIGADPGEIMARIEALEAGRSEHELKLDAQDDAVEAIHTRLAALETWHPTPRP